MHSRALPAGRAVAVGGPCVGTHRGEAASPIASAPHREGSLVTVTRKPQKIDHEKSEYWALASIGSIGLGPFGGQVFDLANRATGRAHRLEVDTVGEGTAPVTGSLGSSDYANFITPRPVNFFDFDGTTFTIREESVGLYSWTAVSFWKMTVKISGGGLSVPGLGVGSGKGKVLFSDGYPLGSLDVVLRPPVIPDVPGPRWETKTEEARMYPVRGDVLFDYNKHLLKPGRRTESVLHSVGSAASTLMTDEFRLLVVGHTDSIGGNAYNMKLSQRRADTVMRWLIEHNYVKPDRVKAMGAGEKEPVASNATREGRAENRRVELVVMLLKHWTNARS